MKRIIISIFILAIIGSFLSFLTGCEGRTLSTDTPTALVIIAGNHNNSKKIDIQLQDKIKNVYSCFGNICVVVVDGHPSVMRNDGKMVGFYDAQYIENSKEDYKYKDIWERDYLYSQISILSKAVGNCSADNPEVDTLKSLHVAVEALNQIENSMGKDIKKEIIIYDTGLCTSGALSFLDANNFRLVKSGTKIWDDVDKRGEVQNLIEKLDNKIEIPDLSDVIITWYGIGKVDDPQPALDNLSIQNLQYIWGEILKKANVIPSNVGGSDKIFGIFVSLNADESISYNQTVTPVILWDKVGEDNINIEPPPKFTEEKLGFLPGKAVFRSQEDVIDVLCPYADNLKKYPEMNVLLVGTTADPSRNGGEVFLSNARANRVREVFISLGIAADRIDIIGLGANDPWHEDEWKDGQFNESVAKKNRAVYLLPRNSHSAKQVMGEN